MKNLILSLLLMSGGLVAGPEEYVNFLRQRQIGTTVQWDMPVELTGNMFSPYAAGPNGSSLELWALHVPTGRQISLAREIIGAGVPTVSISIETGDPYAQACRTRVDQPITVRVNFADLPPTVVRTMSLSHVGVTGAAGNLPDYWDFSGSQFSRTTDMPSNGSRVLRFPSANLTGADLTKVCGLEYFQVGPVVQNNGNGNNEDDVDVSNKNNGKLFDPSGSFDDEQLVGGKYTVRSLTREAVVQVWPVADGAISGLDPQLVYQSIPPVKISLGDLYPDSTTYVRAYRGSPGAPLGNPVQIGSACVIVRDVVPQNRTMVIDDLGEYLTESGSYTLEVLHETPFGTEVLSQFYPLQVDWSVGIRGMLITEE